MDWNAVRFLEPTGHFTSAVLPHTAAWDGEWFNGLVLTNPGNVPLEIQIEIYEKDGDRYTGSVTVGAEQQAVGLVPDLVAPTTNDSDAVFGDKLYWMICRAKGDFYSFLFIGNGAMAQGYLGISPF